MGVKHSLDEEAGGAGIASESAIPGGSSDERPAKVAKEISHKAPA